MRIKSWHTIKIRITDNLKYLAKNRSKIINKVFVIKRPPQKMSASDEYLSSIGYHFSAHIAVHLPVGTLHAEHVAAVQRTVHSFILTNGTNILQRSLPQHPSLCISYLVWSGSGTSTSRCPGIRACHGCLLMIHRFELLSPR